MTQSKKAARISSAARHEIDTRWAAALPFFTSKKRVIFLSYCRFWEKHAFVQQSLAKVLVDHGIEVVWLDGGGWRPYSPQVNFSSSRLRVSQLFELPGRRFAPLAAVSHRVQRLQLEKLLGETKTPPLIWVQGGIDEALAGWLPNIDVFSTFDDPFRHSVTGELCQKARLILCQNSETLKVFQTLSSKALLAYPPVDMDQISFDASSNFTLPKNFPAKRMGYVGSFFAKDYDFILFEHLVRNLPDVGFILAGRTDSEGERAVKFLSQYPNFAAYNWVPRPRLGPIWRSLDVCLLLYRPATEQSGAYPTKVIEASYFRIPSVATRVAKTQDLEGIFQRSNSPDELTAFAVAALSAPSGELDAVFNTLYRAMHPKLQLAQVAERLAR